MTIADLASKVIGDKRRWKAYKARVERLPAGHRTAVEAVERYLMRFGADGDSAASMFEDLADLFERAAAHHQPVREVVGADPVEFARRSSGTTRRAAGSPGNGHGWSTRSRGPKRTGEPPRDAGFG